MLRSISIVLSLAFANSCLAAGDATIIHFNEREQGIEPYPVRYIMTEDLLRIDDDSDDGDYVLYDDKSRIIYSVNHSDSTILVIKHSEWSLPKFQAERNVSWKKIDDAPKINNKNVLTYWLSAGETVCTEAQVVEGLMMSEAKLLQRYRQTLSAEQVTSLVATPPEMQTPCMLVDQVYNTGEEFTKGFPIQQWHVNGLQRLMTSFKVEQKVSGKLFDLPKDYQRYSMGDNLSFGEAGDNPQFNQKAPAQPQVPSGPAGF